MIRSALFVVSLACWPAAVYTQRAWDLASLAFSPGPASGHVIPDAAAVDEAGGPRDSAAFDATIESIRRAEDEIRREEALSGPTSPALLERLEEVAALYRQLGDYPFAIAALQRAHQIIRASDGLYALSQLEIMETLVDTMEEAGAYYEADTMQAAILELARRNEGDPRVPAILVAVADRQMDAVTAYIAADGWERSLERVDAAAGWDLEHVEVMRMLSRGRKPLNRLDVTIRDVLTDGSYEIGERLDARALLAETYARIGLLNDYQEAGYTGYTPQGLIFGTDEIERDLAQSALLRARRLYRSALQTMLQSEAYGGGEYLATQQKMLDTYYFELGHVELYSGAWKKTDARSRLDSARVGGEGRRGILRQAVYGTGTAALEAQVINLLAYGGSAVEIARALLELGDWHLRFSNNGTALELYQDAHDLLVRESVPVDTRNEVVSPAIPVILCEMTSDDCREFDPSYPYLGWVEVAVETGRFGDVKKVDVVGSSAGTSPNLQQRARTHVFETRYRPRFEDGQPRRSDRFSVRYYYDSGQRDGAIAADAAEAR